jgi:hypothetical protein
MSLPIASRKLLAWPSNRYVNLRYGVPGDFDEKATFKPREKGVFPLLEKNFD